MQVKHRFVDVDNGREILDTLPYGKYQVIGSPQLHVNHSLDDHDDAEPEYVFVYRVGRTC